MASDEKSLQKVVAYNIKIWKCAVKIINS